MKFYDPGRYPRDCANEYFACVLGTWLGLSVPEGRVVEVSDAFLGYCPDLNVHLPPDVPRRSAGMHFGSLAIQPHQSFSEDLVSEFANVIANPDQAAGTTPFDLAINNWDRNPENVLLQPIGGNRLRYWQIDHARSGCASWIRGGEMQIMDEPPGNFAIQVLCFRTVLTDELLEEVFRRLQSDQLSDALEETLQLVPNFFGVSDPDRDSWCSAVDYQRWKASDSLARLKKMAEMMGELC